MFQIGRKGFLIWFFCALIIALYLFLLRDKIVREDIRFSTSLKHYEVNVSDKSIVDAYFKEFGYKKTQEVALLSDLLDRPQGFVKPKSIEIIFTDSVLPHEQIYGAGNRITYSFNERFNPSSQILTLEIQLNPFILDKGNIVEISRNAELSFLRTLYTVVNYAPKQYQTDRFKEIDEIIEKYRSTSNSKNLFLEFKQKKKLSGLFSISVDAAGTCTGDFYCGRMRYKCSVSGASCDPSDEKPCPGTQTCTSQCELNYETPRSCQQYFPNANSCKPGAGACSTSNCAESYCAWDPGPPCTVGACGGYYSAGSYYCADTARPHNGGCANVGCYTYPECAPAPTSTPRPAATTQPAATATPRPPTPYPTNLPTPTPACTEGANRCSPKCQTCNAQGQWYDNNDAPGCGGWFACECKRDPNYPGCQATPVPPSPTPPNQCGGGCGFCEARTSTGQCVQDFSCCHRTCVNGTCTTVDGPGTSSCDPNGSACAMPTSVPGACVQGAACNCSGADAANCAACGGNWCNGGSCDCGGGTGPSCTTAALNCSGFSATAPDGTVVRAVPKSAADAGTVQVPILTVKKNELVRFYSDIWAGGSGTVETTNFDFGNGKACTEMFQGWPEAYGARWCNIQDQATESSANGGTSGYCMDTNSNGDLVDDLTVSTCRCRDENGTFNSTCNQLIDDRTTSTYIAPGMWTISNTQMDSCNHKINTTNPCQLKVEVQCDPITKPTNFTITQVGSTTAQALANGTRITISNAGQHTLKWNPATNAQRYALRIDRYAINEESSWNVTSQNRDGNCVVSGAGDICIGLDGSVTSYSNYNFEPGYNYTIWIHAINECYDYSQRVEGKLSYKPKGYIGVSSCDLGFTGWACDLDRPQESAAGGVDGRLAIDFYRGIKGQGGILIDSTIADKTGEAAIGTQCGGFSNHRFQLDIPANIRDGGDHQIYAYARNIGKAMSETEEAALIGSPVTITGCADPWVKLKDTSYNRAATTKNIVPRVVEPFDTSDTNLSVFIDGINSAGLSAGTQGDPNDVKNWFVGSHGANFSLPHNWRVSSITATAFDRDQYINYVKSRKTYTTITSIDDIKANGIYMWGGTANFTINKEPAHNYVLIVPGTQTVTIAGSTNDVFNNAGKSVAIIGNSIAFDANLASARGIFIAKTINTGLNMGNAGKGLKITGNIIATQQFNMQREWNTNENIKPAVYIVSDNNQYLDLLPYLSTAIYESKEVTQ